MTSPVSRWMIARYFLRLGGLGFGGPIALVGAMHRDLVEARGWISEAEYQEGMALAQLSPGPLAAQLCFYLGYVRAGVIGAGLAGLAFVLPSFLIVLGLGYAYVRFGGMAWVQAVFYGVGAAVIGLIARSAWGLLRKSLAGDVLLWGIAAVLAVATVITGRELVSLILTGGALTVLLRAPPAWLRSGRAVPEAGSLLLLAGFFVYAGTFVFGSGLAIVPFLYGGVVREHHWLTDAQFRDAVAVALITPGPVVISVGFIGYLVAGFSGAVVAATATFLPCFVLTVVPAPWFRRSADRPWLRALVAGITAGAVGAIAGAVLVLGRQSVRDTVTALIALATLLVAVRWRRVPEPVLILVAGVLGWLLAPG